MAEKSIREKIGEYLEDSKTSSDFYKAALKEVRRETDSFFKRAFVRQISKHSDFAYDLYKNDIGFWRNVAGDDTAKKAVKLLILYHNYRGIPSMIKEYVERSLYDSERIGKIYEKFYRPNAGMSEMRFLRSELKAELMLR